MINSRMCIIHDCPHNRENYPDRIGEMYFDNPPESRQLCREDITDQMVGYVIDDAGAARLIHADQDAIVRHAGEEFKYSSVLVGFYDFNDKSLLIFAVHSYLDIQITDLEAIQMVSEYLNEIGKLGDNSKLILDFVF